jgi:hypothetical protein
LPVRGKLAVPRSSVVPFIARGKASRANTVY